MSALSSSSPLNLDSYRALVQLDAPANLSFVASSSPDEDIYTASVHRAATFFYKDYQRQMKAHSRNHGHGHSHGSGAACNHDHGADDDEEEEAEGDDMFADAPLTEVRRILRDLLTIRDVSGAAPIPDEVNTAINTVLQHELQLKGVVNADTLPRAASFFDRAAEEKDAPLPAFFSQVSIWRGDITKLKVDCVVNAANSQLLGCFQPKHLCIDNVIHAAAGPRLREDCFAIMDQQRADEPTGAAKATRAYNLPSRFVLHTVGPQLANSQRGKPTREQEEQLCSAYRSCLDLASQLPNVKSVAFCCISTGLFGFPQQRAAELALGTTSAWLSKQASSPPSSSASRIESVIFNVFKPEDETFYLQELQKLAGRQLSTNMQVDDAPLTGLPLAVEWLRNADSVLIAGAAGLSAEAGLDYTSEEVFKKHFPIMHKKGFRCFYEFIGYRDWTPKLQWGYLLSQINLARFNWPKSAVYAKLKVIADTINQRSRAASSSSELAQVSPDPAHSGYFVLTTNADGMFGQNNFPLDHVFTTQGDYSRMQCLKPCSRDSVWPIKDFIDAALPHINPATQEIDEPSVIPRCKRCGGPVMMNVRGGDWFLEWPHEAQKQKYQEWLQLHIRQAAERKKHLVVLEIGAGFNTPSVIRWPMEGLATRYPDVVKLVRINLMRPEVPEAIDGVSAVGLGMGAEPAIDRLLQAFQ